MRRGAGFSLPPGSHQNSFAAAILSPVECLYKRNMEQTGDQRSSGGLSRKSPLHSEVGNSLLFPSSGIREIRKTSAKFSDWKSLQRNSRHSLLASLLAGKICGFWAELAEFLASVKKIRCEIRCPREF